MPRIWREAEQHTGREAGHRDSENPWRVNPHGETGIWVKGEEGNREENNAGHDGIFKHVARGEERAVDAGRVSMCS